METRGILTRRRCSDLPPNGLKASFPCDRYWLQRNAVAGLGNPFRLARRPDLRPVQPPTSRKVIAIPRGGGPASSLRTTRRLICNGLTFQH